MNILAHLTGSDPKLLWYLSRATGVVCLILLTLTAAMGVASTGRAASAGWPRFLTQGLHRNLSLIAVLLLAVHIATVVADSFVPIDLRDAFLPFLSSYRRFWLGLGTLAFDIFLVIILTSLLRRRLHYRGWRLVHWSAYLCWPLAVFHGLGTGSDARLSWVGLTTVVCVGVVALGVLWRLAAGWPRRALLKGAGAVTLGALLAATYGWAAAGPLAPGWSKKAGTPPPPASVAK